MDLKKFMFPVMETDSLTMLHGKVLQMPDEKVITRLDTGKPIATVGRDYELVTNQQLISTALEEIDSLGFEYDITKDSYVDDKRMRFNIKFPEIIIPDGSEGGNMLQMDVMNSYDLSMGIQYLVGAYRLICSNGLILGKTLGKFYHRHTKGFEIGKVRSILTKVYKEVPQIHKRILLLQKENFTNAQVEQVKDISSNMHKLLEENIKEPGVASDYEDVRSVYDVLKVLTWYASHQVKATQQINYLKQISNTFGV